MHILQHNKCYIQQTYSQHYTNQGKTETVSFKIWKKAIMSIFSTVIHLDLKS